MTISHFAHRWSADLASAIGNTPLIRLRRASEATGCTILGKAEFMNPGGSVKDRAGLAIITDAERTGALQPGGTVVEGTAGNTGIGLTLVGNARGYHRVIVMPETHSQEKIDFLRMIGADLRLVPAKPYRDPGNYVHVSRRMAEEMAAAGTNVIWANQFDNLANREGHRTTTGVEIWDQTDGKVDAFTCSCGTGGTLAGVALALKEKNPKIRIVLADPEGSALYGWVKSNDLTVEGSSITEGIGQSRVPDNLANREGHRLSTGPEIWDQTGGKVDAFTCACGTGGTLAGIALALKEKNPAIKIVLADPEGSGLFGWVKSNDLTVTGSSITEGIGQGRVPGNLAGAPIDDAERIPDAEALEQIYDVLIHEGLSVGTSSGINIAAAIRVAKAMGPGHTIVTILCDGGARYASKLFNPPFLREKGLPVPPWMA